MKQLPFLTVLVLMTINVLQAQTEPTGSILGKLTDKEMGGEPLPFANVLLKDSSIGSTTDMEGQFALEDVEPGTYTLVFSFVGYETLEVPNVAVAPNKVTTINAQLGSSAAALEEVLITTVSRKDSQVALLLEQKKAIEIKESIGARELARMGVSDVATATSKIAGVTASEASGDLYVRGLGDRYLYTTFNGLPIPSDDVERKNIDLGLFPTSVIQNVSISKTFSVETSADQASGAINILSRELAGSDEFEIGVSAGINTNVVQVFDSFRVSPNQEDVSFGFYNQDVPLEHALNNQAWDPRRAELPINRRYSLTAGKSFGNNLRLLFTGSQSSSFEYSEGMFREYRSNNLYDYFSDVETFKKVNNTTGLLSLEYRINANHRIQGTSLFLNKVIDEVYESGRNAKGVVFEETASAENLNQFIRDQNIKQTRLWVNQIHGFHELSPSNDLNWAVGYNKLSADEPNRIRNELNIDGEGFVQLGRTGGFQQRKSSQIIDDTELNAFLKDQLVINRDEEGNEMTFLELGANFRNKEREFMSRFFGVTESDLNTVNPTSIDELTSVFTTENFEDGDLKIRSLSPDVYNARLRSYGGFANFNFGTGKWDFNLGARYQEDELEVDFDVNNYPSTLPQFSNKSYKNIYPSINIKYSPGSNSNLRFAGSRTITLPEFKEIAPFQYVSQTGQVTRGNPNLEASTNLNLDLKYEIFPGTGEVMSITTFYKKIDDPINRVQDRGAAGVFSYFNAGEQANVYGIELSAALDLLDQEAAKLALGFNATRMWHEQDLKNEFRNGLFYKTFQYNSKKEVGLQGASNWIFNGSLNFSAPGDNPFQATLVANYASDKIYALGAPEIQTQPDVFYNDEIIEKGFVTLDVVLNKKIGQHWVFQVEGENLLNPQIKRVQNIRPSSTGIETTQTVRSYSKGAVISMGINYSF